MRNFHKVMLGAAFICSISTSLRASFVVDIGDVITNAGTNNVIVPIFVTTPVGDVSQFVASGGYNLAIDIQPPGNGVAAGLTFVGTSTSGFFNSVALNTGGNATFGIDGIVNANGTNTNLVPGVATASANLVFNVGAGVAPGTVFTINFIPTIPGTPPNFLNVTGVVAGANTPFTLGAGAGNFYSLANGSITIQAIPEPSSMLLAGSVAAVAGFRTWRKRRATAKV